ncbi:unnamed protein product [Durusdinium trenchii]|uniref:Uncharacterized protein n=1 Tax=Durusdinium trenchii TaxID=1381693 RepID=A0ABP0RX27_9DINO
MVAQTETEASLSDTHLHISMGSSSRTRRQFHGLVAFAAFTGLSGAAYGPGYSIPFNWRACRRQLVLPLLILTSEESFAEESFNPLKLKGYFWETGKFYSTAESADSQDIRKILSELTETASILQTLESTVADGNFEELKTQLRGANFSESLLRIRGKAVLNILSQQESTVEDDEKFRDVQQAYVLLGQELNGLNGAIDSATVDFSRGALEVLRQYFDVRGFGRWRKSEKKLD